MAQATRKSPRPTRIVFKFQRGLGGAVLWVCAALTAYLMLALLTYNPSDPGWLQTAPAGLHSNVGGIIGAYFADITFHFLGYVSFFLPVLVLHSGWWLYRSIHQEPSNEVFHPASLAFSIIGLLLIFMAGTGLVTLQAATPWWCAAPVYSGVSSCGAGGVLGVLVGEKIAWTLGYAGASVVLLGLLVAGSTLFFGISWAGLAEWIGRWSCQLTAGWDQHLQRLVLSVLKVNVPQNRSAQPAEGIPPAEEHPRHAPEVRIEPSMGDFGGDLSGASVADPAVRPVTPTPLEAETTPTAMDPGYVPEPVVNYPQADVTPPSPPVVERVTERAPERTTPVAPSVAPVSAAATPPAKLVALAALMPPLVATTVTGTTENTENTAPRTRVPNKESVETTVARPPIILPPPEQAVVVPAEKPQREEVVSIPLPPPSSASAPLPSPPPRPAAAPPKLTVVSSRETRPREPSRAAPSATPAAAPRPVGTGVEVAPPSLGLLDGASSKHAHSPEMLEYLSRQVETHLAHFNVEVQVVGFQPGPVVTRFELQPAPGVKVSQITNLSKDIARSLSVISVRVVEVIPGRPTVGLEIPNERRELVSLGEVLRSPEYERSNHVLPLTLGKDIGGKPVVVDLQKMPHLLVAGTTGSGKSVGMNAMVLSLLCKLSPSQVRLIMVDPKMLELSVYQGIPHLLAPVVTDMKEAANALRWCVAEMDQRYRIMAAQGVRNIDGFNQKVSDAIADGDPIVDLSRSAEAGAVFTERLPYIVVLIDELADLMMVVGKKVEELIARLAQKARAAGIHLIIATQRPSVDVITGLIKANIPTRIAFQVSSRIDSRTILDQQGAEQLLGHGDMLYLPPGLGVPVRVHGAFVSDQEVNRVVEDLKKRGSPNYIEDVLRGAGTDGEGGGAEVEATPDDDPLFEEALRIVTETGRASVSGIQRRLKIGYNRAARLVEEMERCGVVGPLQSNGAREVLKPAADD